MVITFVVLGFSAAAAAALYALTDLVVERREVRATLRAVDVVVPGAASVGRANLTRPVLERVVVPAAHRLHRVTARLTPLSAAGRIRLDLVRAGSPAAWDAERVMTVKLLATAAGALVGLLLGPAGARRIAAAALLAAGGWWVPDLVLRSRADGRQDAIRRALPDALDLLAICVEAGLGFDAAMARTASESTGPVAEELNRTLREMQLGRSRADALRELGERTSVPELRSFVLAMIQADAFGASISQVLQVQAREMRAKRRQRAEEQAQKLPVKIVFPVLFCIFPALFVVLLGPSAISIYRSIIAS